MAGVKQQEQWSILAHLLPDVYASYLGHESVGPCVLLIFEDNIRVVIRRQFFKTIGVARNFALGSPAGSQGLLGDVGAELFVGKRDELLREPPLAVPPPRPAALRGRCKEEDQGTQRGGEKVKGKPHRPGRGGRTLPRERDVFSISPVQFPTPSSVTVATSRPKNSDRRSSATRLRQAP